jgi:tetratricopeptide (TPR) repeat protein
MIPVLAGWFAVKSGGLRTCAEGCLRAVGMTNRLEKRGIRADGVSESLRKKDFSGSPAAFMNALGFRFRFIFGCLLAVPMAAGQTFEINSNGQVNSETSQPAQKSRGQASKPASRSAGSSNGMGWGNSIEVARQARAAEQALNGGNYAAGVDFAERAAHAAPQNTDFWFMLGFAARLAGQYEKSIDAYKRGLENQPNSVEGLSGMAQTYVRMGRTDDAKKIVMQVLAANPRSAADLNMAGELFLTTNDPQRALELLRRADTIQPSARTEVLMARAYTLAKQPELARQTLERARSRAPHDPSVLRSLAGFYRDTQQYDLAIAALNSVAAKPPELLADLGYTYQLAGKKKDAAETYARAADAGNKEIGLQLSAAQAFANAGDRDRAEQFLKRAEGIDAHSYRLHAIRGQVDAMEGRTKDAIQEYETAMNSMPQGVPEGALYPVELRLSLNQLYREEGDDQGAQRQISLAWAALKNLDFQDANRPEFLRLRANVEGASGRTAEAEKDFKEALTLDPGSVNITLNYANLLWRMNQKDQAREVFAKALQLDPTNASALASLGYLSRDMGDQKAAEKYFLQLASVYPNDYVAYLALGDMYAGAWQFDRAQASYEKGYKLAPSNPLFISGGINAGIEAHQLPISKSWLDRATAAQLQNPQVMREHERYLTFTGKYAESAQLGYKTIEKLPHDPEAPVYLAYDLLFLGRYDESWAIVKRFEPLMPKDRDLPLIAGYIHAHDHLLPEAAHDFTRALERDPTMATGYMNRGYVYNDMREGTKASADFHKAIELRPDYGEAHLGLSYADLQTRRAKEALKEANVAEKILGESVAVHLARAEAYRQQVLYNQAVREYEAALRFSPNDIRTYQAMADAHYRMHRYGDSIRTLNTALQISPNDPVMYSQMAHAYAALHQRSNAMRAIAEAERTGGDSDRILLATGDALLTMGDRDAAMNRFTRALNIVGGDRLETRISLARLFQREGRWSEAREQIAEGFAEARVEQTQPVTPQHILEAADLLMAIHDFDLSKRYFERAEMEGADPQVVAIGMANAYLAEGQTASARAQLASLGPIADNDQNYDYIVALANVYRQQQDGRRALSLAARASEMNPSDDAAQRAEFALAGDEGRPLIGDVSMLSNVSLAPIFEDINIYQLDARLFAGNGGALPPPRSSFESLGAAHFKSRMQSWPVLTGFVEERNARGRISIPSTLFIQDRDTYDTIFNGAVNPTVHLGTNTITLTPGLQFTLRRDTLAARDMNQNLFRQFLYVNTNSFGNWLSFSGQAIREAGPFTEQKLHSRDLSAFMQFTVGRPWGKTSLLTGYGVRDVLFRPLFREYYTTTMYAGLQRKFGSNLTAAVIAEYLRSWRIQDTNFATAQAMRPGLRLDYQPSSHWDVQGSFTLSRGEGLHVYDNVQNEFTISYVKGWRRALNDGMGSTSVSYPLRFSVGLEQQTFYDFPGQGRSTFLPIIRLTLF